MPHSKRKNHALTDKDLDKRSANCVICGPVKIYLRGGYWRCESSYRRLRNNATMRHRLVNAGMTKQYFEDTLEMQGRKCAICLEDLETPHADHNHEDGSPRGILCGSCNRGIGLFKDNVGNLQRAIDYLDWYS